MVIPFSYNPSSPRQHVTRLSAQVVPDSTAARSEQPDPWIHGDPWSQYLSSKAAPSDSSGAPAPRQTSGLEEQEARLAKFEVKATAAQLGRDMTSSSHALRTEVASVKQDLGSFKDSFQSQLQENIESLRVAQQAQQNQMQAGFLELKALLQPPTTRPSAKRPHHMDLDGAED